MLEAVPTENEGYGTRETPKHTSEDKELTPTNNFEAEFVGQKQENVYTNAEMEIGAKFVSLWEMPLLELASILS